ncbi:unnamed protein product [Arabidopsis arenosa]|uniref:Gnk2-homologous domain-containing protein n=1 Tax=Arabidopsis arenosa TaxID=38785 RepID=A0A8S2AMB8_ARAAE|nr:unnamed protein product [Arabidopsis arenosa]
MILKTVSSATNPIYLYHICPNTTTFSRNSTYLTNLRTVLSSLSSPNAAYASLFDNATAGEENDDNRVYGLFLCRGDVSAEICRDCLAFAVNETLYRCPREKVAVIWYDECMLRYSNQSIVGQMRIRPAVFLTNKQNITENQVSRFTESLPALLIDVAVKAALSSRKFATEKANFTVFQTIYSLVQCTPDLTNQDCESCLRQAINWLPRCCDRSVGGRVIAPSCSFRYELYPFYNETIAAATMAPPPSTVAAPPLKLPSEKGKGKSSTVIVSAIAVPVSVCLLLLGAMCWLLAKRRNKLSAETEDLDEDGITSTETLQFQFSAIEAATNKFSESNKLGHGGFGEVYKVWKLWVENSPLELVDEAMRGNFQTNEVIRCIHIALLCVQDDSSERPSMDNILVMMNSFTVTLPIPKRSGFLLQNMRDSKDQSAASKSLPLSVDDSSITIVHPR